MGEYICPNCKNPIYDDDALLCHFCGESLKRSSSGTLSKMRYGMKAFIWYFLIGLVLIAFLFILFPK